MGVLSIAEIPKKREKGCLCFLGITVGLEWFGADLHWYLFIAYLLIYLLKD